MSLYLLFFVNSSLTDQSGTRIFLGVSGADGRPITSLPGDNSRKMSSFTIGIDFNANGNAVSVSANNKTYSIENWNKYFTEQNAKSNFKNRRSGNDLSWTLETYKPLRRWIHIIKIRL